MTKTPRRIWSDPKNNPVHAMWTSMIRKHHARQLRNGENPSDYPDQAIAFETPNFGWILSAPDINGKRAILVQF